MLIGSVGVIVFIGMVARAFLLESFSRWNVPVYIYSDLLYFSPFQTYVNR